MICLELFWKSVLRRRYQQLYQLLQVSTVVLELLLKKKNYLKLPFCGPKYAIMSEIKKRTVKNTVAMMSAFRWEQMATPPCSYKLLLWIPLWLPLVPAKECPIITQILCNMKNLNRVVWMKPVHPWVQISSYLPKKSHIPSPFWWSIETLSTYDSD